MPKYGKFYDDQLSFSCETELREQLLALAYMRGFAGSYAETARVIMRKAVEETIVQLDPDEQRDFKKILGSVRTKTLVTRMERQENERSKFRKERLVHPDSDSSE